MLYYDKNLSDSSLLNLPTALILHILRMLPHSPYYKCLNVCKHLNEIEHEYVPERSAMCICRLHEDSPNLPSWELKLLICREGVRSELMQNFIKIIEDRCPTCTTTIIGEKDNVEAFMNYLEMHEDRPNVGIFLENCEPNIYRSDYVWEKSIDLRRNELEIEECIECYLEVTLGENEDLIKRLCHMLRNSCFRRVSINCNAINLRFFVDCLMNYCHIFDVLDFQKKITCIKIDSALSTTIHADLLSGFHNLGELSFTINEIDSENIKSRILELAHVLKQPNLRQLRRFTLLENSPLVFSKDLLPAWADLFNTICSKDLRSLDIRSKTLYDFNQNHLTTQCESSNSLSLVNDLASLTGLESLTIYHLGFDITLIRILPSLPKLKRLDLYINMDMSQKNIIDELCHNLEKCNNLEAVSVNK